MSKIKCIVIVCMMIALVGCKEKISSSYLMRHPKLLKQKVEKCQAESEKSQAQAEQCEEVLYAAANVVSIINEQQADPEKFGQKILETEIAYVAALQDWQEAKAALKKLQQEKAGEELVNAAQEKVKLIRQTIKEKKQEMQVQLGILSLSSPE